MPLSGSPVRRLEDHRLLTGGARFVADLDLPDAACVTYVVSPVAHARITAIDVANARTLPGVIDIVTAAELALPPLPPVLPAYPAAMARSLLASDVVRFVGEPIVAIVAETEAAAEDAREAVIIDFDPLPAVVGIDAARAGEVLLFPDAGTNVALHAGGGRSEEAPEASEVVVDATFVSPRLAPAPMEPRAAAVRWEDDGRLTYWLSCQGAHPVRSLVCAVHGLDPAQVRVIVPDVGGSFGAKGRAYCEDLLLPVLARRAGRPVRWIPSRSDDMVGLGHSRAQVQHVTLGARADGVIESLRVHIEADAGAYPMGGAMLPRNTGVLASGPYRIQHVAWTSDSYVTNTTPTVAYRGAGRPEAAAILERALDLLAVATGIDPAEVRRRNLLRPDEFPYPTPTGLTYDSGDYLRALDRVLTLVAYDEVRAEQTRRRAAGATVQVGVGLATFLDRTAGIPGSEYGSVELRGDGSVLGRTGSTPYGQGHVTTWTQLIAERTGLPAERIEIVYGDTDAVPRGGVTGGSRSVQKAGSAIAAATDDLVARARELAADLLEASAEDLVLDVVDGGHFHVVGTPSRWVGWTDVAHAAAARSSSSGSSGSGDGEDPGPLRCESDIDTTPTFPSGAYACTVEVDTETGAVRILRMVTIDDAGVIVNPLLAEGQVHGGLGQGLAQGLLEEFCYDDEGNPLTPTFADYPVISATELPSFEGELFETPSPNNPLGAKGIAESGTIGAPPALQNAVIDALSHLGVTHIDMPCTSERVWRAITAARRAP